MNITIPVAEDLLENNSGENSERSFKLLFHGVAWTAAVWVNGERVHESWSAYTTFSVPLNQPKLFSGSGGRGYEVTVAVYGELCDLIS